MIFLKYVKCHISKYSRVVELHHQIQNMDISKMRKHKNILYILYCNVYPPDNQTNY